MTQTFQNPLMASKSNGLRGTVIVPGDKSISHRAIMFGAIAEGKTHVTGLLEGEDVLCTVEAMRAMGARITPPEQDDGVWVIEGVGLGNLTEPADVLDMGNSGTSARLLMGLIAGHPITASLTGDASLVKRPMGRVLRPLEDMGVEVLAHDEDRLPLTLRGSDELNPISYELPVASAQVKSAILLAGLNAEGKTTVIEPKPTRDHTEIMLRNFGAEVTAIPRDEGGNVITVTGRPQLTGQNIHVPADPSSAAFPVVAALITPDSDLHLPNVGMNPNRTGLYQTLIDMGADLTLDHKQNEDGEPVADIHVKTSTLQGIEVPRERVPSMIDEFPILSMAAACAEGTTIMTGLEELRVKESDRLEKIATGLKLCGADVEMGEDSLTIHGHGTPPEGGATVETAHDHRIAMSFLMLGGVTAETVQVDDGAAITTSFPGFTTLMNDLGCVLREA